MSNKVQIIGLMGMTALVAGFVSVGFAYQNFAGLMIVGLMVVILGGLLIPRLLPRTDRKFFLGLAILGLIAKIGGSLTRLGLTEGVWGFADADRYNDVGIRIADALRVGDFPTAFSSSSSGLTSGTQFTEILTGFVYVFIGPTIYGAFLFFAFAAFIGAMFFIKAFEEAFEGRNLKLFAVLMFFYPSLLLWPSSLGKDAILFFFAGIAMYGVVRTVFRSRVSGLSPLVIGMAGLALVRPHVAVIAFIALGAAMLIRNPGKAFTSHIKYSLVAGIFGALIFVGYSRVGVLLDLNSVSVEGILSVLSAQAENEYLSGGGGSNFAVTAVGDPFWLPMALIAVFFRPFPWEASSVLVLAQSGESLLLAALVGFKLKNILRNVVFAPKNPMLVYVTVFLLLNVVVLSTLGNFGLLSRQRALLFPFLFVLVAAQWAVDRRVDHNRLSVLSALGV